jgi:hypothetical protein
LIETVTLVLAPAANVPLVADRLTQVAVFVTNQSNAAVPLLVNVYTWLDGLNDPPIGPLEVSPVAGLTIISATDDVEHKDVKARLW